ncbi:MAG: hypothetical protein JWM31_941, partial [Solirubrobacterales bacterium]|nr:hypothetical protein [Solirubrobacterales bacterium]
DAWPFAANTNRVGLIDLHFFDANGASVNYYECIGDRAAPLGTRTAPGQALTSLLGASPWLCGRLERHFAATAVLPDGTPVRGITSVRTVSCAHRFTLRVPAALRPGREARVRILDRWGTGGQRTRLCVTAPDRTRTCHSVAFPAASAVQTRTFRASTRGTYRVDLDVRGRHQRQDVAVGVAAKPAPRLPALLATGDSTMQGVESSLADDLGDEFDVTSDVHPGFSISSADGWAAIARDQVRRLAPTTTVVSLGAAEGFPMRTADGREHACCDPQWEDTYVARLRRIMDIYRQGGKARVYYLTIAAPRQPARAVVVDTVNRAIVRAGKHRAGVTVLRMDLLFSPSGYQDELRDGGREVSVREPDGVHLNASGTAIEGRETAKAIRGRPTEIPPG